MVVKRVKHGLHLYVPRAFLSFSVGEVEFDTSLLVMKGEEKIHYENRIFNTSDTILPERMKEYVAALIKKYPILYIGTIFLSYRQGTLVNDAEATLEKMYGKIGHTSAFYNENSLIYAFEKDVNDVRDMYEESFGYIDFLFPPQIILKELSTNYRNDDKRLFILVRDSYVSYAIIDENGIYYSNVYVISLMANVYSTDSFENNSKDDDTALNMLGVESNEENIIDFDKDITTDEDFGDIEDELNRFDDIELETVDDKFSEIKENTSLEELKLKKNQEEKKLKKLSTININMNKIISMAYNTINSYYNIEGENVDFVSDIILFDEIESADSIKIALEEKLMLKVTIENDYDVLGCLHRYMIKEIS